MEAKASARIQQALQRIFPQADTHPGVANTQDLIGTLPLSNA